MCAVNCFQVMFVVNFEGCVEIISAVDFKFDRHNFNISKKNISKPIEIKEQNWMPVEKCKKLSIAAGSTFGYTVKPSTSY